MKRIKSFGMTFLSIVVVALGAVLVTPQGMQAIVFVQGALVARGIPLTIVLALGVFLAECWKAIVNLVKTRNAQRDAAMLGGASEVDLY